ncbi:Zinc finger, CCHC-type [Lasallia pustulata]|uniref:Zinc finger, CCHC-type n=1 Tax=Lasallia pustulata TaxID=136370 RepID=A0A1W5CWF9_9LECA|nr:Zinc finger, CCHC-type [Lasallia pustulata]
MTVMAIRINNCLYERHKKKGQSSYGNNKKTAAYTTGHRCTNRRQKNDKYGPRPMEIDAIEPKKKKTFDGECYNCGKKGHLEKDCRRPTQARKAQRPNHEHIVWIGNHEGKPQQITMVLDYSDTGGTNEARERINNIVAQHAYQTLKQTALQHCPDHTGLREYVQNLGNIPDMFWGEEQLVIARGLRTETGRAVAHLMLRVDYQAITEVVKDLIHYIVGDEPHKVRVRHQEAMGRVREVLERDLPIRTDESENDNAS